MDIAIIKNYIKDINPKPSFLFFTILALPFLFYTVINNIPLHFINLIKYYLFKISYEDCKNYYPRLYFLVYSILRSIPFIVAFIVLFIISFLAIKKRKIIPSYLTSIFSLQENKYSFFKTFALAVLTALPIHLLAYYLLEDYPLSQNQLFISRNFIITFFLILGILFIYNTSIVKLKWTSFIYQKSSPYRLAIYRIILFPTLILAYAYFHEYAIYWFQSTEKTALPYMGWFIFSFDLSVQEYQYLCIVGIVCAAFISIGFLTKWMLWIHAIVGFLIIATPNFYGKLTHDQIYIWIPWILAFSRCYDVWSIDAIWKKNKGIPFDISAKSDYTIPIKIIWLHIGIIYFFAGFDKLWSAGFDWALSNSMINQILIEWVQNYDWKPTIRIDHYPNLVKFGGLVVILFELSFPFLLFKFRRRIFAIIAGLSFHNINGYFMRISFPHLQALYIFFINWDWVFYKVLHLKNKINKKSSHTQKEIYFKNILEDKKTAPLKYGKTILYVGLFIFGMNTICGIFTIHSYPFSAYPGYSNIVPDDVELLHFEGYDINGKEIDILKEGKAISFTREHYTIFENNIISDWKNKKPTDKQILDYWKIWYLNIPTLKKITHLKVYYHKTPLLPDKRKEFIINELIYDGIIE
jgi:hypothetical protein